MTDWTVGLFFGRASAELGGLGHPVPLVDEAPVRRVSATTELTYRRGQAARSARDLRPRRARLARHASASRSTRRRTEAEWELSRELIEFAAAQEGCYWICEDGGEAVGYARACRFGEMEELTRLAVAPSHRGRGIARALLEHCWPERSHARTSGGWWWRRARRRTSRLFLDFGVMPVTGPLVHACPGRRVHRAPLAGDRLGGAAGRGALRGSRGDGVEAARAAGDRPPPPAAARVLRPHPHLPRDDGRRRGVGAVLDRARRARSARRSARRPRTWCR